MKKILLTSLAALALASCVSDNDLNPAAEEQQYGYINVSVSNDPVVVTRDGTADNTVSVNDFEDWSIKAYKQNDQGTDYGTTAIDLKAAKYSVAPGTYKVAVEHPANIDNLYSGHGSAHYKGGVTGIEVEKTAKASAEIDCGPAQNAKIRAEFPTDNSIISGCKITLNHKQVYNEGATDKPKDYRNGVELTGTALEAYYLPNTNLTYQLTYTYKPGTNETADRNTGTVDIQMGDKGTEKLIKVITNDNGTISVQISHNKFTEDATPDEYTIDAATGDYKKKETTTP